MWCTNNFKPRRNTAGPCPQHAWALTAGDDFQAARESAIDLAKQRNAHMVPSFRPDLVRGVATYWWEFFKAAPHKDVAYVPIGMGSGAASAIAADVPSAAQAPKLLIASKSVTTQHDFFGSLTFRGTLGWRQVQKCCWCRACPHPNLSPKGEGARRRRAVTRKQPSRHAGDRFWAAPAAK